MIDGISTCPYCDPDCSVGYGRCHCGCGGETKPHRRDNPVVCGIKGNPQKYIHRHRKYFTEEDKRLGLLDKWSRARNKHRVDPDAQQKYLARRREYVKAHRIRNPERFKGYKLQSSYGLSLDDYNQLLQKQNGKCAICHSVENTQPERFKYLCVDHNHVTKAIRGLLCNRCNRAIGMLGDDPEVLKRAALYLEQAA